MATTWIVRAYCKTSGYAMRWPDAAAFHEPMARLGAAAQDDGGARDWEWLWVERHNGKAMRHHGWLRGTAHMVSTKYAVTHKDASSAEMDAGRARRRRQRTEQCDGKA